ncbi:DASH complex subunit Dad4 [Mrakia frigida]|uniref:Dad4p n=1 Tax=Mrakia frigida TaxID=29902 RepID=UPI003FCC158D
MENPHLERQSLLLARIIKNVDKCNEAVRDLGFHLDEIIHSPSTQDIIVASRLFENYNRNVAYNLERINAVNPPAAGGAGAKDAQQGGPSS